MDNLLCICFSSMFLFQVFADVLDSQINKATCKDKSFLYKHCMIIKYLLALERFFNLPSDIITDMCCSQSTQYNCNFRQKTHKVMTEAERLGISVCYHPSVIYVYNQLLQPYKLTGHVFISQYMYSGIKTRQIMQSQF